MTPPTQLHPPPVADLQTYRRRQQLSEWPEPYVDQVCRKLGGRKVLVLTGDGQRVLDVREA